MGRFEESSGEHGGKPLASANAANGNAVNRGQKPLASANAANRKAGNGIAASWKVLGLSPIRCFLARPEVGVWVGRFLGVGRSLDSDRSS